MPLLGFSRLPASHLKMGALHGRKGAAGKEFFKKRVNFEKGQFAKEGHIINPQLEA